MQPPEQCREAGLLQSPLTDPNEQLKSQHFAKPAFAGSDSADAGRLRYEVKRFQSPLHDFATALVEKF